MKIYLKRLEMSQMDMMVLALVRQQEIMVYPHLVFRAFLMKVMVIRLNLESLSLTLMKESIQDLNRCSETTFLSLSPNRFESTIRIQK